MPSTHLLTRVTDLNVGRVRSHERPHKPALLLAILSLIESGRLLENRIEYGPDLFELFRKYFAVVQTEADAFNLLDPFWRLKSDGLLEHVAKPGFEHAVAAQAGAPSVAQMQGMVECTKLADDVFEELRDPAACGQLRQAIIGRYFAGRSNELESVAREEQAIGNRERLLEQDPGEALPEAEEPVRNQAFRRVVLRAYDHRCAACGLRVVLDDLVLVDAAHLVPWNVTQDDDPRNGMALCKNHHWALDRSLIAPTATRIWKVSRCLDDRIEGQRDLLDLRGRSLLLPQGNRFQPRDDALAWREARLRSE